MKKEKIKIFIIISVIVAILATIGVISVFQYRKITLEKYNTDIQEQLTNLHILRTRCILILIIKKIFLTLNQKAKLLLRISNYQNYPK